MLSDTDVESIDSNHVSPTASVGANSNPNQPNNTASMTALRLAC